MIEKYKKDHCSSFLQIARILRAVLSDRDVFLASGAMVDYYYRYCSTREWTLLKTQNEQVSDLS